MTQSDLLKLEGRLNGLREILKALASQLPPDAADALAAALHQCAIPQDQQEDPGAVTQLALVVDAAASREIQLFLDHVGQRRTLAGK